MKVCACGTAKPWPVKALCHMVIGCSRLSDSGAGALCRLLRLFLLWCSADAEEALQTLVVCLQMLSMLTILL